jgi:predicted transcriptional regulator
MGTSKVADLEESLDQVDIQVKNPTIVVSVRLDPATAQQLSQIARLRGQRISDLLREAVVSYAATGGDEPTWFVTLPDAKIGTSRAAVTTGRSRQQEPKILWELTPAS